MVRASDGVEYEPVGSSLTVATCAIVDGIASETGESRSSLIERLVVERLVSLGHPGATLRPDPPKGLKIRGPK